MSKSILYLTYDGLSDPLGQSQILPYLVGLEEKGYEITVISFEKNELKAESKKLKVIPLKYHKSPPVLSTLYDIYRLRQEVKKVFKTHKIDIIHCRSYITSLVGLWAKRRFGVKFIFDMRGFWADERVEGGLWNLDNPVFKKMYQYFKKKEKQFVKESDTTISLTQNAKREIEQHIISNKQINKSTNQQINITVIPTCADLDHFNPAKVKDEKMAKLREELGIQPNDFVVLYLGSLGTWYMLEEMLDFYDELKAKNKELNDKKEFKFLFVTKDQGVLRLALKDRGYQSDEIIITESSREDVPKYIALCTTSVFFIKPSFSKKASAATKMGEIMAMGRPVITNVGWGDVEPILNDTLAGVLVKSLDAQGYNQAAQELLNTKFNPVKIRQDAEKYFSLAQGIEKYAGIYSKLLSNL